jgi:branched-chain amino acid transport system ATP-binding protein
MSEPLLSVRGLDAAYGPVQILFSVDMDVAEGEVVALLGTNGAGKSTLLKAVTGLLRPRRGVVRYAGRDITAMSPDAVARLGVALMPGGRGVFPGLRVEENLRLAAWMDRARPADTADARDAVLELFPVLRERLHEPAGDLSGGQQQMLALACTLMTRPRLLLIDELSLGLAPVVVGELLEVVREINRRGTTVVVVEQSVTTALQVAARAVFMEKGQVRFTGPTADLLDRPDLLRAVFLAGAQRGDGDGRTEVRARQNGRNGRRRAGGGRAAGPDGAAAAGRATGGGLGADTAAAAAVRPGPDGGAPVLVCRGVTRRFGGIVAVDGVDLEARRGRILGLIGHNGAGKTTLLDCISGFWPLHSGRIVLAGTDVTGWPPHRRAAAGLGRSFQDALLYPTLTVAETIAVACERHAGCRAMVADALALPASYESELAIARRVEELLDLCGLGRYRDTLAGELSTGTRRVVELACILAQEPAVVLLDEPSAGVAQRETEALGPLLVRVRDRTGCAMVVVEHDMGLMRSVADELVALEQGAVIARGTPDEVLTHPRVVASYLGSPDPDPDPTPPATPPPPRTEVKYGPPRRLAQRSQ